MRPVLRGLIPAALLAVTLAPPAMAAAGAAPTAPHTAAACQARPLPVPAGARVSEVRAGDPTGRWLVGTSYSGRGLEAVRWLDRELQPFDVPVKDVAPNAVNADGAIAGVAWSNDNATPFAFVEGQVVRLGVPAGYVDATATSISRVGTVGGHARRTDYTQAPVVWSVDDPLRPTLLTLPTGYQGSVDGMSPRGEVVVAARDANYENPRSFLYSPNLTRRELSPSVPGRQVIATAAARGWAAGSEIDPATGQGAVVRWPLDTRAPEVVADFPIYVDAVNAHGVMVGQRGNSVLIDAGIEVPLAPLPPYKAAIASSIADDGLVAGSSGSSEARVAAVTWRC